MGSSCIKLIYSKTLKIFLPSPIILSRCACLGNEIIALRYNRRAVKIINQQKSRVDTFINTISLDMPPKAIEVKPHMERVDVYPAIEQQESMKWLVNRHNKNVKLFIMDSFSELVDQEFRYRNKEWSFNCVYSDIRHDESFNKYFYPTGLLDINKIKDSYQIFFDWITSQFPNIKIVFINFPTKYDDRAQYILRGKYIYEAVKDLAIINANIINIKLDDNDIEKASGDDFPYHLSKETILKYYRSLEPLLKGIDDGNIKS
jgi:hypothetical protein